MIRPLLALSCLLLVAAGPTTSPVLPTTERGGIIVGPGRAKLVADWEVEPQTIATVERGYCVMSYSVVKLPWRSVEGETLLYVVTEVAPATVTGATPWEIASVSCPAMRDGSPSPTVHTHPPSLCNPSSGVCVPDDSRLTIPGRCEPSDVDVRTVTRLRLPFAIVQCGPRTFSFYGPPQTP